MTNQALTPWMDASGTAMPLLAQDTVAVDTVLQYFASVVLTPLGIAGLAAGSLFVGLALFIGRGVPILSGSALVLLSMMIQESTLSRNILIGPLQSLRSISRPLSFALLTVASLAALAVPVGDRGRTVSFPALTMYLFQMYFVLNIFLFSDALKGVLAALSVTGMFVVCVVGYGRRMQDAVSARGALEVFAWVAAAYCMLNFVQIAASPGNAVIAGRFAGISGNPQQAGAICSALLLVNLYLFNDLPPLRPLKWICGIQAGVLGLLLAWTGSRSGALSAMLGLLLMYRLQFGRILITGLATGSVLLLGYLAFEESSSGFERLTDFSNNTRAAVFAGAVADWMSSPVVGVMPFGGENGVESSYLRALANLGLVGGIALLVPVGAMAASMPRVLWIGRSNPEVRKLADLYFGLVGSFLLINAVEGFFFGVMTFPMMITYSVLSLGGFLTERYPVVPLTSDDDGRLDLSAA